MGGGKGMGAVNAKRRGKPRLVNGYGQPLRNMLSMRRVT